MTYLKDMELIFGKFAAFNILFEQMKFRSAYPTPEILYTLRF